jgi:Rad3-related DNA helicase
MSSAEVPGGGKEYVVVVTTYPTTYGANEGVERTEKRFLQESNIDVYGPNKNVDPSEPGAGFQEYKAAVAFAREILDNECAFTDHDFTEEDEPPFDSADFENYDNDEEVCIAVMTKEDFAVMLQSNMQIMGVVDSQGNIIERPAR